MANSIKAAFPNLADDVKDDLETNLEALRDNDYGQQGRQGRGGANYGCTSTEMLPLTATLGTVDTRLDRIKTSVVMGGGTMAHLGVTWGRRMLAHSWRTVWGDSVHPIDPADREVTKVLILLTDGGNALEDDHSGLPGRLHAKHVGVPDCLDTAEDPPRSCRQGDLGTYYSALGRLGPAPGDNNDKDQGYYYPGWGLKGTTGGGSKTAETALTALMKRSCALARGEGLTVYTIGAMPERPHPVEGRPRRVLGRIRDRRGRPRGLLLRSRGPHVARGRVQGDRAARPGDPAGELARERGATAPCRRALCGPPNPLPADS